MADMNLSKIENQVSTQIEKIEEELKIVEVISSDPKTTKFVNSIDSISQTYRGLLKLDKRNITPKLKDDLEKLTFEIEKLKKQAKPDVAVLRSVLAVFEAIQEDLKVMKNDPDSLKRGERVEDVENERFDG